VNILKKILIRKFPSEMKGSFSPKISFQLTSGVKRIKEKAKNQVIIIMILGKKFDKMPIKFLSTYRET
jgi:hypothetical protein